MGDGLGRIASEETGDDAADEAGPQRTGQQPADHPRRQARTVGDGIGDIAGQQRHHQLKGALAADLHQRGGQAALLLERLDTEDERQGDQQTARHHHRQHVGNTGEQMLVGAGFLATTGDGLALGWRGFAQRSRLAQGPLQRLLRLFQCHAGATAVDLLAGEAAGVHLDIGGQQHGIGRIDGSIVEQVARTDRAAGFHLQFDAHAQRRLLQRFGGHEGMRYAGRAGSDSDQPTTPARDGFSVFTIGLSTLGGLTQKTLRVGQCLGRRGLKQALAGKAAQRQLTGLDHQHPVGRGDLRLAQWRTNGARVMHLDTGLPAQALGCSLQQARTQHAGDLAIGAGGDDQQIHGGCLLLF